MTDATTPSQDATGVESTAAKGLPTKYAKLVNMVSAPRS